MWTGSVVPVWLIAKGGAEWRSLWFLLLGAGMVQARGVEVLQQLMVSSEVNMDDRETAANILDQVLELATADEEAGSQVLEHFEISKLLDSLRINQTQRAKLFLLRTLRQQVPSLLSQALICHITHWMCSN
jgi:hypothetical protein